MIVKMKKLYLLVMESRRQESLERLREAGVLHLKALGRNSETLENLREKRSLLERALIALPPPPKGGHGEPVADLNLDRVLALAGSIVDIADRERAAEEELDRLRREEERAELWGDFDPRDIRCLEEKGIHIGLYELSHDQYRGFPQQVRHWVVGRTRSIVLVAAAALRGEAAGPLLAAASSRGEAGTPFAESPLPARSLSELREAIGEKSRSLQLVHRELEERSGKAEALKRGITLLDDLAEFEQARTDMETEGRLAYLAGFVPVDALDGLRQTARTNGWALLVEDPAADEPVPTLIRNPRWIRMIRPVFGILETVPGYREFDISFWFLLFFSVFFAMLIGDAGYGLIFLVLTALARSKMRDKPAEPFMLMYVLSVCTIAWGAVTGTWFGVEAFSRLPVLSWLIIPAISSWTDSAETVMLVTFIIGAIHLSIAHSINVITFFPSMKSLAQLGWLIMVWGMFFGVRYIVLQMPLNPATPWLIGIGFLLVVLFEEQQGRFLKGMGVGLAKAPLKALNSISLFADIISYVRLFAVGLASLEIARAFNAMAASAGWGFPAGLFAAFALFFGHALNIVMGGMAIFVHGIRLNMLEFSGHLGMEWSGFPYRPFRNRQVQQNQR